jgi:predicted transcriptional regulator YdeE
LKEEEDNMEPRIIERAAFTVIGLQLRSKNAENEIPRLWATLDARCGEIKNRVPDRVAYGISANVDAESGEFDYIAGFEISSTEDVPEGMVAFEVPGGRYAVCATTLAKIGETFQSAYHSWLPQLGEEPSGGLEFERYDERFDPQDPNSEFDLYLPLA